VRRLLLERKHRTFHTIAAMLMKEKNNRRVLNGVRSVLPVSAVVNIIRGRYKENAAIATGVWAEVLDKKIFTTIFWSNKTITFICIEPLYCTFTHNIFSN